MNDNKFTTGLLLGLILGGGAVFLLGTKTGKNLLKIISEQGMDGLLNLLEEYNFESLEEMEEVPQESFDSAQDLGKPRESEANGETKSSPKKRFFRRIKK
jgi:gas vesicle protein